MVKRSSAGFTLIELVIVIVILGVLAVTAAPRFLDLSSDARVAALESLAGEMQSTINLARAKARAQGLRPVATNPNGGQTAYVVDFGFGVSEVDFRNLCPESMAELNDALSMVDFMNLSDGFESRETNQHTLIGFDVPSSGTPTNQGCYVLYDSFGSPDCTIEVVADDC